MTGEQVENGTRTVWESNGSVYTRPWVVELILDLCGYDSDKDLVGSTAVEPCCGDGEFLEAMALRLSESCRRQGRPLRDCDGSLVAVDVDPEAVARSRARVERALVEHGCDQRESAEAAQRWVREADFLLDTDLDLLASMGGADFVFGNPPYVRLEAIDEGKARTYRSRYKTMIGRADLYVAFYERALRMLAQGGLCGFICADRWMLNQYGAKLRELVTTGGFAVDTVLEMHKADTFQDDVLAYPAVTVIRRGTQGRALVARFDSPPKKMPDPRDLAERARDARSRPIPSPLPPPQKEGEGAPAVVVDGWFSGSDPWPCEHIRPELRRRLTYAQELRRRSWRPPPKAEHAATMVVGPANLQRYCAARTAPLDWGRADPRNHHSGSGASALFHGPHRRVVPIPDGSESQQIVAFFGVL